MRRIFKVTVDVSAREERACERGGDVQRKKTKILSAEVKELENRGSSEVAGAEMFT